MGRRIPDSFAELWYQFRLSNDQEPMFSAIGIANVAGWPVIDQTLVNSILSTGLANLQAVVSASYFVKPSHILFGNSLGDPLRWDYSGAEVAGTRTGSAVPQNTSLLVRKLSSTGGRANRGRMYIPGVTEPDVDAGGIIDSTALTALQTSINSWSNALIARADVEALALFHQPATEGVPTSAADPTIITALSVQQRVATQRRRLRP